MRKKVELADAKQKLGSEAVFQNGDCITYANFGKYQPNITFEMSSDWVITSSAPGKESVISPLARERLNVGGNKALERYINNMNVNFGSSDKSALFGHFRTSQSGKPVFAIDDPTKSDVVLIEAAWGGAFSRNRGIEDMYELGAIYSRRASSNGGGMGSDYVVLPIGYVRGGPEIDVSATMKEISDFLKDLERQEEEKVLRNREIYERGQSEKDIGIKKMQALKDECEKELRLRVPEEMVVQIMSYMNLQFREDSFSIWNETHAYHDLNNVIADLEKSLQTMKEKWKDFEKDSSSLDELKEVAKTYGLEIETKFNQCYHGLCYPRYELGSQSCRTISELQDAIKSEIEKIEERQQKKEAERAEMIEKARIKRANEISDQKGYPSDFQAWHRIGGATNQSCAIVINSQGGRRFNDSVQLTNPNHRFHTNWEVNADGTQKWDQIRDDEIIVRLTKDFTKRPWVMHIDWMPHELTEKQFYGLLEEMSEYTSQFVVEPYGDHCGGDEEGLVVINLEEPGSEEKLRAIFDEHIRAHGKEQMLYSTIRELEKEYGLRDIDDMVVSDTHHNAEGDIRPSIDDETKEVSMFFENGSTRFEVARINSETAEITESIPLARFKELKEIGQSGAASGDEEFHRE